MSDADFIKHAKTWLSWKAIPVSYDKVLQTFHSSVFEHGAQLKTDNSGAAFAYRWKISKKTSPSKVVLDKNFFDDIAGTDAKCNKKV